MHPPGRRVGATESHLVKGRGAETGENMAVCILLGRGDLDPVTSVGETKS